MVRLAQAGAELLDSIVAMEAMPEVAAFITLYTAEQHLAGMRNPDITYLAIVHSDELAGYMLLVEEHGSSVELRRLVVSQRGLGIGQQAMLAMEEYCQQALGCSRIWLDVYASNERGRHVYHKLGYRQFDEQAYRGQRLLLLEKHL
ncbi:GNAT family N-acetyltransferase [Aliagarivorans marinus]|uniref:GNAT family N-acetyltransferase n=1 Tax=Aliagarivorans marinus TaxID=561965 RepID=UPI0004215A91|nr:GNAT family N-acetyltransferase [Aliagarivorans marinus]